MKKNKNILKHRKSTYLLKKCVICKNPFFTYNGKSKGKNGMFEKRVVKNSRCVTCSKKCSRENTKLLQQKYQKIRRCKK